MNVALTRARLSLWIVGNCEVLCRDRVWKALLDSAQERNLIASIDDFDHLAHQSQMHKSSSSIKYESNTYCEVDRYLDYQEFRDGPKIKVRWKNGDITLEPFSQITEDDPNGIYEWIKSRKLQNHASFKKSVQTLRNSLNDNSYQGVKLEKYI